MAAAVALARAGQRCWLMHRRDVFAAPPGLLAQLQDLRADGRIRVLIGQITRLDATAVHWLDAQGCAQNLAGVQRLAVFAGIHPRLGPLLDWGLALEHKHIAVDAATLATSWPGVWAIGDVVHYPGKRKFIACAFHEATLATFAMARYLGTLRGENPRPPPYTTANRALHAQLGVA